MNVSHFFFHKYVIYFLVLKSIHLWFFSVTKDKNELLTTTHDDACMKILQCQYLNLIIQDLHTYKQFKIHT